MTPRHLVRLAAAALVAAAAGVIWPLAPATAATCPSSAGVSVVVDFTKLGGGIATTCVADGGGENAGTIFEVDHDLTRVQQFPGAVCKVDDTPADAACRTMPPSDAYWGLFWSDGDGGWTYSSEGVDSLEVPDGGAVAFAWQDGGERDQPGVAAPQNAPKPTSNPSPTPSSGDTGGGGGGGTSGSTGGTSPTQSTSPAAPPTGGDAPTSDGTSGRDKDERSGNGTGRNGTKGAGTDDRKDGRGEESGRTDPSADTAASPSDDPSDAVPVADPTAETDGGLAPWVAPVAVAGLFAVAGVVALLRRRSAG